MNLTDELKQLEARRVHLQQRLDTAILSGSKHRTLGSQLTSSDAYARTQLRDLQNYNKAFTTIKTTKPLLESINNIVEFLAILSNNEITSDSDALQDTTAPRFIAHEILSFLHNLTQQDILTTSSTTASNQSITKSLQHLREYHVQTVLNVEQESLTSANLLLKVDSIKGQNMTAEMEMQGLREAVKYLQSVVDKLPVAKSTGTEATAGGTTPQKTKISSSLSASTISQEIKNNLVLQIRCQELLSNAEQTATSIATNLFPYVRDELPRLVDGVRKDIENVSAHDVVLTALTNTSTKTSDGMNGTNENDEKKEYFEQLANKKILSGVAAALYSEALKEVGTISSRATVSVLQQVEKHRTELLEALEINQEKLLKVETKILAFENVVDCEKRAAMRTTKAPSGTFAE